MNEVQENEEEKENYKDKDVLKIIGKQAPSSHFRTVFNLLKLSQTKQIANTYRVSESLMTCEFKLWFLFQETWGFTWRPLSVSALQSWHT